MAGVEGTFVSEIDRLYPKLERRNPVLLLLLCYCVTLRGPPWILKRCGLESSGRILISSNFKTKVIAFLEARQKYFQNFEIFSDLFFLDFSGLVVIKG